MPDQTFFEDFGLYRRQEWPITHGINLGHPATTIQRYCTACQGERTWFELNQLRHRLGRRKDKLDYDTADVKQTLIGCYVSYCFFCTQCATDNAIFVVYFGSDAKPDAKKGAKGFDKPTYLMKVGQYPPWSIEPPNELKLALGGHEATFKKGIICESQGYGIGAFAYYRRIVESIIDEMLKDIGELLEPEDCEKYKSALDKASDSTVAQEKIALVKDLLPSFLRPGGINPLGTLHDALSVGIHALDEDDCLALANGLHTSLAMLAKHIALSKQDRDEYAKGIGAVKDRLDKIKQRAKAT